jgi:hypothetical protein
MKKAQQNYVTALNLTNAALADPVEVLQDTTLASVILLGMYENLRFESHSSIQSWMKHIEGACTLIRLRGKQQLVSSGGQTALAHRIVRHFYGIIVRVASESGQPVPPGVTEIWEANTQLGEFPVVGKRWMLEMIRVLRSSIALVQNAALPAREKVAKILAKDEEFPELLKEMPAVWRYTQVVMDKRDTASASRDFVYGVCFHVYAYVYADPWIVFMWNNIRIARLDMHRTLLNLLSADVSSSSSSSQKAPLFTAEYIERQRRSSKQIMHDMAIQIFASTPQVIGQVPFPSQSSIRAASSTTTPESDHYPEFTSVLSGCRPQSCRIKLPGTYLTPGTPTGMNYLVWPLYLAALAEDAGSVEGRRMRRVAVEVLHFIALRCGARQAVVFAEELREGNHGGRAGFLALRERMMGSRAV